MKRNIVIAWAENCAGPGWTNTPIWYIERLPDGELKQGSLQMNEQTKKMATIFPYSHQASSHMTRLVKEKLNYES